MDTVKEFWNCGCEENFVHHRNKEFVCHNCGAKEGESPDSKRIDVVGFLKIKLFNNHLSLLAENDGFKEFAENVLAERYNGMDYEDLDQEARDLKIFG